jgi:hypothetical protein
MLFDVELDRGNLDDLMAIGVGVKSRQSLSTTSASLGIVVGDSRTVFYWIQEPAMTPMTRLPSPFFSGFLFFLGVLEVGRV